VKTVNVADLFCGAGGTSSGAIEAINALGFMANLTAINHWDIAIATHTANHPTARHMCASLDSLNPRELFNPGQLDILWASPECTHHSVARGGKPINDQSRATAWCVVRWAEALMPPVILIENVPEFITWGGIGSDGRPMKSKKGATFAAWVGALESLGYKVGWKILRAADFGDPTTRRRLFIQAVRGKRRICWPDPTHGADQSSELFSSSRRPWKTAESDVIDWSIKSSSIYSRKRPLSDNTMQRIIEGLEKFGGSSPFIVAMEHKGSVRSINLPINTITTAKGGAHGLVQPFIVQMRGTTDAHLSSAAHPITEPIGTVSAGGRHHALVQSFLLPQQSGGVLRPVTEPVPTVSTAGAIGLIEPFLVEYYGNGGAESVNQPLNTVTCKDRHALVQPEVRVDGKRYVLDILFRMLQPHELAAAQGFPKGYKFAGTKTDAVKQIGNAVPRHLARAIVLAAMSQQSDITKFLES
jgi:DNA (cytosine-5)-methyltransferase 1